MKLRIPSGLSSLFLLLLLSRQAVAAASPPSATPAPSQACGTGQTRENCDRVSQSTEGAELPFRLSGGYLLTVEGQIGTQTKLRFILDTGATISIVDSRIADKLKLQLHPAVSLSFDRKLAWQATIVKEVQFGQVKAENVPMLVGRLSEYSVFAKKADAIIGMDLLKRTNFSIDNNAKRITFHARQQEHSSHSGEPLSECIILEAQVQGHSVRLLVDTGFPGLLLYEDRVRRRFPALRTVGTPISVTMGGQLEAKQATLPDVVFGPSNGDVSVLFVTAPPPDALSGIDGIVGLAPLKARRVHFDFAAKRLSWE